MAVNNTLSVKEYALTGSGTNTFPITFEFTTDDNANAENIHCQLAEKNDEGEYTYSVELTEGVAGDFQVDGGNIKFIDDASMDGKFLVIYRSTPVTQLTDFIDNGNYSLEDIERALDKLTFILQERTGTPVGTYINVGVSLFFATLLQLTQKKDVLENLFTWSDITVADRPGLASTIRSVIDAVTKSGDETIGGHKTFTYSPVLSNDPQTNSDATRKSYVDGLYNSAKSYTDGKFPTSNIADNAIIASKIKDGEVTTAKMADGNVTLGKLRTTSVTASITATYNSGSGNTTGNGTVSFANDRIITGITCTDSFEARINYRTASSLQVSITRSGSHGGTKTVTVYYAY